MPTVLLTAAQRTCDATRQFFMPATDEKSAVRLSVRIAAGIWVGLLVAVFVWLGLVKTRSTPKDFGIALDQARMLREHRNPFNRHAGFDDVPYPLTAVLLAFPFIGLPDATAGGLFAGISAGFLAFALTRRGMRFLLVFLCYPFWSAVFAIQWSPLLMAAAFFPFLLPIVTAKPNVGLPVALRSLNFRWVSLTVAFLLLTIALMPSWPSTWWSKMGGYQSFLPVSQGAGWLLLLAASRYRDKDSRFLVLMSLIPQRWYYDALLLWLIPATTAELVATGVLSWAAFLLTPETRSIHQVAVLSVAFNYLPMLALVLSRPHRMRYTFGPRAPQAANGNS